MTSTQYAAILNPNIKFVIEDLGEEVEEVDEAKEESEYYEYGDEEAAEEGNTSFNVEVELASGKKQLIKLTEDEYNRIFEGGDQALLIAKIKEYQEEETFQN